MRKKHKRLRLIQEDQLNHDHSWFSQVDNNTFYLFLELRQKFSTGTQHVQKVCALYAAMETFANELQNNGHQVIYLNLDDTQQYAGLEHLLQHITEHHEIDFFDYQHADDYASQQQLVNLNLSSRVEQCCYDSEHFFLAHNELKNYFVAAKASRMELFYRKMRKRFDILMDGDQPEGQRWNFEVNGQQKIKSQHVSEIPEPLCFCNPVTEILKRLERHNIKTIGRCEKVLLWPVTRGQAIELLAYFCSHLLPSFGLHHDTLNSNSPFQWSLFHSRLSFALNCKLISPQLVLTFALQMYRENPQLISLSQIERFVRQLLGWREFVRGIYWANMPEYQESNALGASQNLPSFFSNGQTKMNCLRHCIAQSLEFAYAHHGQRLMVLGNFCLISGIEPKQVDQWFLTTFIDAMPWVQLPNSHGMSQFADGGLVASKPYAASANYVHKMSDYCGSCHYKHQQKHGDKSCPFNSLYWSFMIKHREHFEQYSRLAMLYKNWDRQPNNEQTAILEQARCYSEELDFL
ncbi:cryptochrome/photolyase family protein [Alginatibacterium sediminis]|uniref:Cryptochrome/photolyase family protein n=1 Tax=Alginatibacterium sediminis TaxID=2164068 RepID=A0A420EA10_9ALTE|nr:cryptochrome/photolyase family protein [Alginatibacterium sediminis]RKF17514.1 cryptochrome/photolyase family protein [Alginatibacterium sediminis]